MLKNIMTSVRFQMKPSNTFLASYMKDLFLFYTQKCFGLRPVDGHEREERITEKM